MDNLHVYYLFLIVSNGSKFSCLALNLVLTEIDVEQITTRFLEEKRCKTVFKLKFQAPKVVP